MAAFKRAADRKTLTKQIRMQNDIEVYNRTQTKPSRTVRVNPDFPVTRQVPMKGKKSAKQSAIKVVIAELWKRVEKWDQFNSLAQVQADMSFGHIAR